MNETGNETLIRGYEIFATRQKWHTFRWIKCVQQGVKRFDKRIVFCDWVGGHNTNHEFIM